MIIYGLHDSGFPDVIRYVGKTVSPLADRLYQHVYDATRRKVHRRHKDCWIRSVVRAGRKIQAVILDRAATAEELDRMEKYHIGQLFSLGVNLTNTRDGGGGGSLHTTDQRERMAAGMRRRFQDPEYRARASAAQKHRYESEEERHKMREAMLRRAPFTEEHRRRISEAAQRRTPETIKKQSESLKKHYEVPGVRERLSASQRGVPRRPRSAEHSKHASEAQLRRWERKQLAGMATITMFDGKSPQHEV